MAESCDGFPLTMGAPVSSTRPPDGGWFRVANAAMDHAREVGPVAFVVYVALSRFADANRQCFPSAKRLSDTCGITKRSVWNAIKILEGNGWIRVRRTHDNDGNQTTNLYTLTTSLGDESDSPGSARNDTGVVNQIHPGSERNAPRTRPIEKDPIKKTAAPASNRTQLTFEDLRKKWNQIKGVRHCRAITNDRRKHFNARMNESKWLAGLNEALEHVAASDFLQGGGSKGWRADIDWFLSPGSLTKILEGKYDGKKADDTPKRETEYRRL